MNTFLKVLAWGWPIALLLVFGVLYFRHLNKKVRESDERTRQLRGIIQRLQDVGSPLPEPDIEALRNRLLGLAADTDSDEQLALVQRAMTLLNRYDCAS